MEVRVSLSFNCVKVVAGDFFFLINGVSLKSGVSDMQVLSLFYLSFLR